VGRLIGAFVVFFPSIFLARLVGKGVQELCKPLLGQSMADLVAGFVSLVAICAAMAGGWWLVSQVLASAARREKSKSYGKATIDILGLDETERSPEDR